MESAARSARFARPNLYSAEPGEPGEPGEPREPRVPCWCSPLVHTVCTVPLLPFGCSSARPPRTALYDHQSARFVSFHASQAPTRTNATTAQGHVLYAQNHLFTVRVHCRISHPPPPPPRLALRPRNHHLPPPSAAPTLHTQLNSTQLTCSCNLS